MSGKEQQHAGGDDLLLIEHVATFLGRDEITDQIFTRAHPSLGDHSVQELGELTQTAFGSLVAVRAVHRAEDEGEDILGPPREIAPVLGRDSEEIADDAHRQRACEALDEVELMVGSELLDQLLDEGSDPAAHALHRPGAECVLHQLAQPRVARRIGEHDPARQHFERRPLALHRAMRPAALEVGAYPIGGQAGVAKGGTHVVVTKQEPGSETLVPVQRCGLAQAREVRVGIGDRVIGQQLRDLCHAPGSSIHPVSKTVTRKHEPLHGPRSDVHLAGRSRSVTRRAMEFAIMRDHAPRRMPDRSPPR